MPKMMRAALAVVLSVGARAGAAEPIRVACVGASIMAGVGTKNPRTESYPAQLQMLLGTGYRVEQFGHSGATLTHHSKIPFWTQPEYAASREFAPQIVVIQLGANDAFPGNWERSKDTFVPTLKEMAAAFAALPSRPRVYFCLPAPILKKEPNYVETGVVPLARQACREAGIPIIDLFGPLAGREELFDDQEHPNAVGAGMMAAIIQHAIADATERKKGWRVVEVDSEEKSEGPAADAIDGKGETYWHTGYSPAVVKHPHRIEIDLGAARRVIGVSYLPRQAGVNGRIRDYEIYAGGDARNLGQAVATGRFSGKADEEFVFFKSPVNARYVALRALSEVNGGPWSSVAELDVLSAPGAAEGAPAAQVLAKPKWMMTGGPFQIGEKDFLLDGKRFVIRSGEMHAARVPREYWRHRLEMVRALGCNTVCAYLFWNQHESRPGGFDFTGQADAAEYCRIAQQVGLKVILRPGPYSCAEWDFGGLPSWLLKHEDIKVRTRDPRYVEAMRRYLLRVGKELSPLQVTHGGPIIMVQVENEYGAFGNDRDYIGLVRDALRDGGFDVPMFTCDGGGAMRNDVRDDLFCAANFGSDPEGNFRMLREVRASGPLMVSEYYPGWFDSWGQAHHHGDTKHLLSDIGYMLEHGCSFSIYMVHGGTSFGFTNGANSPPYSPQTTSYDYDAPIDEAGRATPKFMALRELISKHLLPGETLPPIPRGKAVIEITTLKMTGAACLFAELGTARESERPLTMERLDQEQGCVLYRTTLPAGAAGTLRIVDAHDFAQVYVAGRRAGVLDRRHRGNAVEIAARSEAARLDILVEAMGRVNFGGDIHDRKGITQRVEWQTGGDVKELRGWQMFKLPFDRAMLTRLKFGAVQGASGRLAIYRGEFEVERTGDTFLDMRGWDQGAVWVNGRNLGRYWSIGPQQTLYVPGCWLKKGTNELLVLDVTGGVRRAEVRGLGKPVLDELHDDPGAPKPLRHAGQTLRMGAAKPVFEGRLKDRRDWQTVRFEATRGRYVCVEAMDSQREDAFTTCAEMVLLNEKGEAMPMAAVRVCYADSEELGGDDGSAANVLDGDAGTFWHTQWQSASPKHPHQIVLDAGRECAIGGVRLLARQDNVNGRMRNLRVYVMEKSPVGKE